MVHIFNLSTWEVEAGGSLRVQGQPGLQSEFQDSQGYTQKPCLEKSRGAGQAQAVTESLTLFPSGLCWGREGLMVDHVESDPTEVSLGYTAGRVTTLGAV